MKSNTFTLGLINKYHLYIPSDIVEPFAKAKQSRVKIKATFNGNSIEFYAALKKDKNSGDYTMMFGNRLQKELGVLLNDYFEMPEELDAVFLSDYEAFEIFESLTPGRKRGIIYTIIRIKNSQSRIDKALILCENLKRGVTNPMELFKS